MTNPIASSDITSARDILAELNLLTDSRIQQINAQEQQESLNALMDLFKDLGLLISPYKEHYVDYLLQHPDLNTLDELLTMSAECADVDDEKLILEIAILSNIKDIQPIYRAAHVLSLWKILNKNYLNTILENDDKNLQAARADILEMFNDAKILDDEERATTIDKLFSSDNLDDVLPVIQILFEARLLTKSYAVAALSHKAPAALYSILAIFNDLKLLKNGELEAVMAVMLRENLDFDPLNQCLSLLFNAEILEVINTFNIFMTLAASQQLPCLTALLGYLDKAQELNLTNFDWVDLLNDDQLKVANFLLGCMDKQNTLNARWLNALRTYSKLLLRTELWENVNPDLVTRTQLQNLFNHCYEVDQGRQNDDRLIAEFIKENLVPKISKRSNDSMVELSERKRRREYSKDGDQSFYRRKSTSSDTGRVLLNEEVSSPTISNR